CVATKAGKFALLISGEVLACEARLVAIAVALERERFAPGMFSCVNVPSSIAIIAPVWRELRLITPARLLDGSLSSLTQNRSSKPASGLGLLDEPEEKLRVLNG